MTKPRIAIEDLLLAIDRRDRTFLDRQSPEMQKTFAPPVALRFASCVQGAMAEQYLIATNELANINYWQLYEYPDLQYRLLALVGSGRSQRHQWLPIAKVGRSSSALQGFFENLHPLASIAEIDKLISRQTLDTFTDLVNRSGCDTNTAKELISAYKKSHKDS